MKHLLLSITLLSLGYLFGWFARDYYVPEPDIVVVPVRDTLTEWQVMEMALALTESNYDTTAVSERNAYGILQLTPIYVAEANRLGGDYSHTDAFCIDKSFEMFDLVQGKHNPTSDIEMAIKSHNPTAGEWYLRRVQANMEKIRTAEKVRQTITKAL